MNAIVNFELCTLSDKELLDKVDSITDKMYTDLKIPTRQIPARPNDDYDLLVGELVRRYCRQSFTLVKDKPTPDYDGQYLVAIEQVQECGNIWKYQKVIECFMNRWVVEDETENVIAWKELSEFPNINAGSNAV